MLMGDFVNSFCWPGKICAELFCSPHSEKPANHNKTRTIYRELSPCTVKGTRHAPNRISILLAQKDCSPFKQNKKTEFPQSIFHIFHYSPKKKTISFLCFTQFRIHITILRKKKPFRSILSACITLTKKGTNHLPNMLAISNCFLFLFLSFALFYSYLISSPPKKLIPI